MRICIIGGKGKMGQVFAHLFEGEEVVISESDEESLQNIPKSEVILISVPIEETKRVIQSVIPYLTENQLLMDLTSEKVIPCLEMMKGKSSVIGLHPMFGPKVTSIEDQTVLYCPLRPGKWLGWVRAKLIGARLVETTPEEHDQMMSYIQCLTHFTTLVFGEALFKSSFSLERLLECTSPVFRKKVGLLERVLSQSASLYANIEIENAHFPKVLKDLREGLEKWEKLIVDKDTDGFCRAFDTLKEKLP